MADGFLSLSNDFETATEADWLAAVEKSLKGGGLERITRKSDDGIAIRPLYREDGFASAQCVPYSGNMSIDRQLAIANARTDLAQQLETKVAALDKVFRERTDVSSGVSSGSTFSSVSKQLTQQTLIGTRPERVDFVEIDGNKNLCVLLTMGREKTLSLFDNMLDASQRSVQPDVREVLLQEFKGAEAQKDLNRELGG